MILNTTQADPYAALRYPNYLCFMAGRALFFVAMQMQTIAVSWQIYQRLHENGSRAALALGMIGLVQVIPIILLALPAGQAADRFSRRSLAMASQLIFAVSALGLLVCTRAGAPIWVYYVALFVAAVGRAFSVPSISALLTMLLPREILPAAMAWNSTIFQLAAMIGPARGGVIVAWGGATLSYSINISCAGLGFLLFYFAKPLAPQTPMREPVTVDTLLSGLRFVFGTPLLLGMLLLDLFAVLLGGATALLPIYAHSILHVGATGFGFLRAAPSIGAIIMALVTVHKRPWQRAGRAMLVAVAGFGVATLVFGLSTSFWISMAALAVLGACDNISVVIRQTVDQMLTPLELRGRVSSISFIFISCSNELGEFESGVTASWFGAVGSVVLGGLGTLAVVGGAMWLFPALLRIGRLHEMKPLKIEQTTSERLDEMTP